MFEPSHHPIACAMVFFAVVGLHAVSARGAEPVDVTPWERVLNRFESAGGLDYAALQADRADLDTFLAALADARLERPSPAERMAFWSNAYNAVVAHHVLALYPDLGSVKDVNGFFNQRRQRVAGEELTLDEIEDRALEPGDPRVHFAVVCASTGCPDLRGEPFVAERLAEQLEEQTQAFLADPTKGMRIDRESDTVFLSSIFKWYAGDFTGGSRVVAFFARRPVLDWVVDHLPEELAAELGRRSPKVRYLDYDWSLNDRPGAAAAAVDAE